MRAMMVTLALVGCGTVAAPDGNTADEAARRGGVVAVLQQNELSRDLAAAVQRIEALEQRNAELEAQIGSLGEVFISVDDDDYGGLNTGIQAASETALGASAAVGALQSLWDDADLITRVDTVERGVGGPLFVDDADFVPLLERVATAEELIVQDDADFGVLTGRVGLLEDLVVADDADFQFLTERVGGLELIVAQDDVDDGLALERLGYLEDLVAADDLDIELLTERVGGLELTVLDDDFDDALVFERVSGLEAAAAQDDIDDAAALERIGYLEGLGGGVGYDDFDMLTGRVGVLEDGAVADDVDDEFLFGAVSSLQETVDVVAGDGEALAGRTANLERTVGDIILVDDVDTLSLSARLGDSEAQTTWLAEQVEALWQQVFGSGTP